MLLRFGGADAGATSAFARFGFAAGAAILVVVLAEAEEGATSAFVLFGFAAGAVMLGGEGGGDGAGAREGMNDAALAAKLPSGAAFVRPSVFFASSSSSVFGQSPRMSRESERSARSLPSV